MLIFRYLRENQRTMTIMTNDDSTNYIEDGPKKEHLGEETK